VNNINAYIDFWPTLKAEIKSSYLLGELVPYACKAREEVEATKRYSLASAAGMSQRGRDWSIDRPENLNPK
jgi:hypothetical protein